MSRRLNVYTIIILLILLSVVSTQFWLLYNSHLWEATVSFCEKILSNYWLLIIPAVFVFAAVFTAWHSLKARKTIALFKYENITLPFLLNERNIKVYRCDTPKAFTFGFWRPCIYLSTAIIDVLNEQELKAVIAHEKYHLANRHNVWSLSLFFIKNALFFLPIVHWLYLRYRTKIELECDKEAARVIGDSYVVASAVLKLEKSRHNSNSNHRSKTAIAMGISTGNIEKRVRTLLGETNRDCWKKPLVLSVISTVVIFTATNYALAQQAANCCFRS